MFPTLARRFACALCPLLMSLSAPAADDDELTEPLLFTLFADDLSGLKPGMFSAGVIGAQVEYHYLPVTAPRGNWVVSSWRSEGTQRAWRVLVENGRHVMYQADTLIERERPYMHTMVVAGDDLWRDYTLYTSFAPENDGGQSGVAFCYQHDRAYYFAGVIGQRAVLKNVKGGKAFRVLDETVLAEAPFAWQPGEELTVQVSAVGGEVRAILGGRLTLTAQDTTFAAGRIAFTADVPTRFYGVEVICGKLSLEMLELSRGQRATEEAELAAAHPSMVVWKKLATPAFGTGRNVRFGDLNGDGRTDILIGQMRHHGPTDSHSEIGCLTAMDLDGKILWRTGIADRWQTILTNDVVFQIHDLDGDGRNEVIYGRDFEIVVADGATGVVKYKAPMPDAPRYPGTVPPRYPRILGDSVAFADLRGTGAKRDLILKDRYRTVWAYTDKLEPLWQVQLNTGHYPFPCDVDGDGRDEILIGYSLVDPDGKVKWTNDYVLKDHADAVALVQWKETDPEPHVVYAASDEGVVFTDVRGNILSHLQLGHVQNISIADFRPDLPGLEMVSINFWANQGIVHLFNAEHEVYHEFEPVQHGSMVLPVNWTGQPGELWCLSANTVEGGLYDGWGRRVVRFPADGHPDYAYTVLDLTGDCRDEIVVWDGYEMWIYTQSDNPKPGRLYRPQRNPAHNESNYRANVSLPGWSE